MFQVMYFFATPRSQNQKISEVKNFGETRINSGYILTFIVVCGRIYTVLSVPVEHHTRWRLLPLRERRFFLPSREGR